jgi:(p)ppGpp synthase/HD superfamily hydrolase
MLSSSIYLEFYVYGLIASIYPPVPETFKDYINSPKKNGYQSIHTGVLGLKNRPIEIQIRTNKMHEQSEKGVSAHFRYKSGKVDDSSVMESEEISNWMAEIREIFENADKESSERLLENVKKNIFMDEIYVFTPKNEFRSLPRDATPIDFAFSIHSDIGFKYIGAKINGRIVPMNYKLQSGDQVEILTSENSEPEEEWMNIAVTAKAKSAISKYIREKESGLIKQGKEIFKQILAKRGKKSDDLSINKLSDKLNVIDEDDFYKKIAKNQIDIEKIFEFMNYKQHELSDNYSNGNDIKNRSIKNGVDKKLKYNILEKDGKFITNLKISGKDRANLLNEITSSIIESEFVNINGIELNNNDTKFESTIALDSKTKDDLEKLFKRIKYIRGVESIDTFQK